LTNLKRYYSMLDITFLFNIFLCCILWQAFTETKVSWRSTKQMLCLENEFWVYFYKSPSFMGIVWMCLLVHMKHMESTQMLPILEDLEGVWCIWLHNLYTCRKIKNLQLTSTMFWQLQMHGPHHCLQVVAIVDLGLMT
jgi:hypothetical protein